MWNTFKCYEIKLGWKLDGNGGENNVGLEAPPVAQHRYRLDMRIVERCQVEIDSLVKYLSREARGGFQYITKYGLHRAWEFFPPLLARAPWMDERGRRCASTPARTSSTPPPRHQNH